MTDSTTLTQVERSADADAEAATAAHQTFLLANWEYFTYRGRLHPVTGRPIMAANPALDREATRLHTLARQANHHAAEIEYEVAHPDDRTTRRMRCAA